jgi:uncharacterized membrane protein SirB2
MAIDYAAVKHVHMSAAALSVGLFALRGAWMVAAPARLGERWVRIVPHVVDTVLLASALWLAWQIGFADNARWLGAKIAALVAYIGLGSVALKRGRTLRSRIVAFVAAIATFAYIVGVALTKSPLGFLSRIA